jgi:hypothetical protein
LTSFRKTGGFLYRGIPENQAIPLVHIGTSPTRRLPIGQSYKAQETLDDIFKLVGFKALRGNSLPTTTDLSFADHWGEIYLIFPINGFNFVWSNQIPDIGGSFELECELN